MKLRDEKDDTIILRFLKVIESQTPKSIDECNHHNGDVARRKIGRAALVGYRSSEAKNRSLLSMLKQGSHVWKGCPQIILMSFENPKKLLRRKLPL